MDNQFERTIGLIGEDNFKIIQNKRIAIVGLGGVGGTALEALARSGFIHFRIMDFDIVSFSNLNRQILYSKKDVGQSKTECAKRKLLDINDDIDIQIINDKLDDNNVHLIEADFIIDAIDDVKGKIALATYACSHHIPLIISLGMANRFDPSQVMIMRLDKTTNDPLAKKFRHELKQKGIDTSLLMTVCSKEQPLSFNGTLNSMMMVPSSAGINIANYVLQYFLNQKEQSL